MKRPVLSAEPDDATLWQRLRALTAARIGLPRAGASLATAPLLAFQLAHARARDAVWDELDEMKLCAALATLWPSVVSVSSGADTRQKFLMRPDFGRHLDDRSRSALARHAGTYDTVFIVSGGLSARAVEAHAAAVLSEVLPPLRAGGWRIGPLIVTRNGRVAIGDEVAAILGASSGAVLIGERPGLSAPDSMGAYLTWAPHAQTTDAERNCISNIRPAGIGYADAAAKIAYLLGAMRRHRLSGVALKDDSDRALT